MKTIITFLFSVVVLFSYGQTCTIDYSLSSPGVSPSVLPNAEFGVPYQEDITLLFPQQDGNGTDYTSFSIKSVKLPLGLTWKWSEEGNATPFDPQTDPFSCMHIYGTPAANQIGSFSIEIVGKGMLADNSSSDYTFNASLMIDSSASSNALFSMSPVVGCDNADVNFSAINMSSYAPVAGLTAGISHVWDFGNGNQSTAEQPVTQTYSSVGDHVITYTRIYDTIGFKLQNIKITGVGCTDAIGYGNPDIYIQLMDGSNAIVYNTESSPNDADLPQNYTMNLLLDNPPYTIRVMDDDSGNAWGTDDDNAIDGNENNNTTGFALPGVNSYGLTTLSGGSGSLTFSYTIQKDTTHVIQTDTVHVYASPSAPSITEDPTAPHTLSVTDLGYVYHWFADGTRLFTSDSAEIVPVATGDYTVMAVDDHGCSATSSSHSIDFTGLQAFTTPQFTVYPNPSSSSVHVQLSSGSAGSYATITDMTGRIVSHKQFAHHHQLNMNVMNLSNGVYTISIYQQNGHFATKKLMIQH